MWEIVKRGICDVFFCVTIMKKFCVIVMWLQSINSICAIHRFKFLFLLNLQLFKRKKIMQGLGKDGENVFVGFEGESAKMLYRRQFWEGQKMFSVVTSGYKIQIRLILMLVAVIHPYFGIAWSPDPFFLEIRFWQMAKLTTLTIYQKLPHLPALPYIRIYDGHFFSCKKSTIPCKPIVYKSSSHQLY